MAFVASLEDIQMIRSKAFTPGNTGGGNPRPADEEVVRPNRPRVPMTIIPRCVPKPYAYPKHRVIPLGPNGRGRYHLLRYACLKSTRRWLRLLRAIKQAPLYHTLPLDQLPIGILDRNPSPLSGQSQTPFKRAMGLTNDTVTTE